MSVSLFFLVGIGGAIGFLSGLFGVGGGAVIVPVLYEIFRVLGVAEEVRMQLCVGTALALIVPTSIRSYYAHKAKGAVDDAVLRIWALPIIGGAMPSAASRRAASASNWRRTSCVMSPQ